jgi:hypothetical protein
MIDRKPRNDQATHGSGKRNAEHTSSDGQRFIGSRNKTVAEAEVDPKERDSARSKGKGPAS